MKLYMGKFKSIIILMFWLLVWQVAAMIVARSIFLPTPKESLIALFEILPTKNFWIDIGATFLRVLMGLSISLVSGIILALICNASRVVYDIIRPVMSLIKTVPVMSLILLFLVFAKSGYVPVIVCTMVCLPIAFINILEGLRNVDQKLIEMGKVFELKPKKIFSKIVMPQVRPYVNTAIMLSVGFSWKTVVTTEVLSIPASSIGYNLYISKTYLDTPMLFAWTIAIIVISVIVEKLVRVLFKIRKGEA